MKRILSVLVLTASCGVSDTPPKYSEELRALITNGTVKTYDVFHGTQIEFHAADGRAYLWYPGNSRAVPSRWKVEGRSICYKYPSSSYNPVTQLQGGDWECSSASRYLSRLDAVVDGDPYQLETLRIPFRIPKGAEDLELDDLLRQSGASPSLLRYRKS